MIGILEPGMDVPTSAAIEVSFEDPRKLETIRSNYLALSEEFARNHSFARSSTNSLGSKHNTDSIFTVHAVIIVGKGSVYNMLDGNVAIGRWTLLRTV